MSDKYSNVNIVKEIHAGRAVVANGNPLAGQGINPDQVPMQVKSVRVPVGLYVRAEAVHHAEGFSGLLREALAEWLDRHEGRDAQVADAMAALKILERVVAHLESAV